MVSYASMLRSHNANAIVGDINAGKRLKSNSPSKVRTYTFSIEARLDPHPFNRGAGVLFAAGALLVSGTAL